MKTSKLHKLMKKKFKTYFVFEAIFLMISFELILFFCFFDKELSFEDNSSKSLSDILSFVENN